MRRPPESDSEAFTDGNSVEERRVLAALSRVYGRVRPPARVDVRVLAAIHDPHVRRRTSMARGRRQLRLRLGVVAAGFALATGLALFPRPVTPTPVSAQSVIRRASLAPALQNVAVHAVYTSSFPDLPDDREIDSVWATFDAAGRIGSEAWNTRTNVRGRLDSLDRCVQRGATMRCFDYQPRSRYLQVYKPTRVTGPETMWPFGDIDELTGAGVPRLLTHLMRHAPGAVHLEPERRFHGVVVYPIRVDADEKKGRPRMTYYFDAATYVLRGDRLPGSQPPGLQDIAREVTYLSSRTVVPLRQIPSRAFIFHPPTGRYLIP